MNLALSPIENDLLQMNIKHGGETQYNIHELPQIDGKFDGDSICPIIDTNQKQSVFVLDKKKWKIKYTKKTFTYRKSIP